MDQFHDGHDARPVRSRTHGGPRLHAGEDGDGGTLRRRRASPSSGHVDPGDGLHVGDTGSSAPHLHGVEATFQHRRVSTNAGARSLSARGGAPETPVPDAFGSEVERNGSRVAASATQPWQRRCRPPRTLGDSEDTEDVGERATSEYVIQRHRPGDPKGAVFRACGYDWVLRRRRCIRPAADGGSPVFPPRPNHSANDGSSGKMAPRDIFLVRARDGGLARHLNVVLQTGPVYWMEQFIDWVLISIGWPRYRPAPFWSWLPIIGSRVAQVEDANGALDGSCVLCACLVCIEAQHRLAFERLHGAGTFPYQIAQPDDFRTLCRTWGVWRHGQGTQERRVLELIRSCGGVTTATTLPGWRPSSLRVANYMQFRNRPPLVTSGTIVYFIHTFGPLLGSLYVGNDYYADGWETRVYRGGAGGAPGQANHTVVCVGYNTDHYPEVHIEVVDNHHEEGPVRWILFDAFTEFCTIDVRPLDAERLREGNRIRAREFARRGLRMVLPVFRMLFEPYRLLFTVLLVYRILF